MGQLIGNVEIEMTDQGKGRAYVSKRNRPYGWKGTWYAVRVGPIAQGGHDIGELVMSSREAQDAADAYNARHFG